MGPEPGLNQREISRFSSRDAEQYLRYEALLDRVGLGARLRHRPGSLGAIYQEALPSSRQGDPSLLQVRFQRPGIVHQEKDPVGP